MHDLVTTCSLMWDLLLLSSLFFFWGAWQARRHRHHPTMCFALLIAIMDVAAGVTGWLHQRGLLP